MPKKKTKKGPAKPKKLAYSLVVTTQAGHELLSLPAPSGPVADAAAAHADGRYFIIATSPNVPIVLQGLAINGFNVLASPPPDGNGLIAIKLAAEPPSFRVEWYVAVAADALLVGAAVAKNGHAILLDDSDGPMQAGKVWHPPAVQYQGP